MKTPFWKTYLAAAALAGLVAYTYFVDSKKPDSTETPKQKVFTFDKGKAIGLAILRPGGETIRLAREKDTWRMLAPQAVAADKTEVESLLSTLENLEVDEVVSEQAASLAEFGLESPRVAVEAQVEGATEPMKLLIGDKVPTGSGVYAKLPTQARVFTIAAYLEGSFDKKPFDFRDRDLLHVERSAVKTLEIEGPEGAYALARQGEDEWAFTKPLRTRAGRWKVDGLLGSLESLRMESVAAEEAADLAPFGLAKPVRKVQVGLEQGVKTLEIGSTTADGKHHARAAGSRLVAVIPPGLVDELAKGLTELRAKRILDVATYDVTGFDVEAEGRKQVYTRATEKDKEGFDSQKWSRTAPDRKQLETNAVQDALFKIGGLEAQEYLDQPSGLDSYGLAAPALRLTLRFEADKPAQWIEIGRKDGAVYGRRNDDDGLLKLDPQKAEEFLKAFTGL